ncbi:recombinase family protein [Nocardia caishijiensis]|uniref:Site-specific DNA recombinase n=1 Tax=Nocardia caishijiensis TaxID=184756 RepID=A0ABQ6YE43_9NOCA|nr:recombinase family protein [Nocardia caishijiensis]KAF0835670.1 site-specific DNA recombinase [Nocardia caishijiensis]
MRALIVIRLSRVTDATTSPERQLNDCLALCTQREYDVVGVAEDLDISGSTNPMDRPNLGRWLKGEYVETATPGVDNHEPTPFDVIVVWRVDRLVRSVRYLQDAVNHARDHGRVIVSATEPHFDMTSPFADLMIAMVGMAAQLELDAIRERNTNTFQHNYTAGKWRGGIPPWGYLPRKSDSGEWKLYPDPVQVGVIREVVDRVIAGEPVRSIAVDLTARKVLTSRDRFAEYQGRPVTGYAWATSPIKRALESQAMLGYAVTREAELDPATGKPLRNAKGNKIYGPETVVRRSDGSPVLRAEPILTREEHEQVIKALEGRELKGKPSERAQNLLLGVIECGVCDKPAWRLKGGPGRKPKYRCASAQKTTGRCTNRSIDLAAADELVESQILGLLGESERLERSWNPGSDNQAELDELNAQLVDLTGQLGSPAYRPGTPQRRALDSNIQALAERQTELESQPRVPAGYTYVGTGETFGSWWAAQDTTTRNSWLRRMNVQVRFRTSAMANGRNHLDSAEMELGSLSDLIEHLRPVGLVKSMQDASTAAESVGIQSIDVRGTRVTLTGPDGTAYDLDELLSKIGG